MRKKIQLLAILVLTTSVITSTAQSVLFTHEEVLFPSVLNTGTAAGYDRFGHAVSLSGHTLLVGLPGDRPISGGLGAVISYVHSGTNWVMQQRLTADDLMFYGPEFGTAVAVDGDYAIIGAPYDRIESLEAGSAYIFHRSSNTWVQQQKLTAPVNQADAFFGFAVSISGDSALVGAYEYDGEGAVFRFERSGANWVERQRLSPPVPRSNTEFGRSVDLDGNTAVVGARNDVNGGDDTGAAYIFVRSGTNWSHQQKIVASDGAEDDHFGRSVAVHGNTLIVGAEDDDDHGNKSGSAYVFVRSGTNWTEQAKLTADDAEEDSQFGWAVDLHGDRAVIGADEKNNGSGGLYLFERSGTNWSQRVNLEPPGLARDDALGYSVAISSNHVAGGTPASDAVALLGGQVYTLMRSGTNWLETETLDLGLSAAGNRFGADLDITADRAIVGAEFDNDVGNNRGAAYIFRRNGNDWALEQKLYPADPPGRGDFIRSVGLSGDYAVLGAPGFDGAVFNMGRTFVYHRNGTNWHQQAILDVDNPRDNDRFGTTLAMDEDTVVGIL
ncbi:MAG: hypothetical protein AAF492_08500, partial [Verrucomicrobiota bacterium]